MVIIVLGRPANLQVRRRWRKFAHLPSAFSSGSFFILPAQLTASTLIGQWPPRGRRDPTVPSSPDLHKYSAETSTESPARISRLQIQTRPVASARRPSHWVMDGLSLPTVPSLYLRTLNPKPRNLEGIRVSSASMSTPNQTPHAASSAAPLQSLFHRSLFLEC